MTTIAGCEHRGKIYLGGDSSVSIGRDQIEVARESKVWARSGLVFGAAGDLRACQQVQYLLKVPPLPRSQKDDALRVWLTKDLAAALRECWSAQGEHKPDPKGKAGADLLIGVRGWLVYFDYDLCWARPIDGLAAIGNGATVAMTSLRATTHLKQPKVRIARALDQAVKATNATRPPFTYVSA